MTAYKKNKKDKYIYFDTTTRNPLRLKYLLKIAKPYEGQVLTNALCEEIIKDLIKFKWFKPESINKDPDVEGKFPGIKTRYANKGPLSESEAVYILNAWKPDRGWPGFRGSKKDPHWAHRWFQYYLECQIYGLIDFVAPGKGKDEDRFAKPFYITDLGHKLISTVQDDDPREDRYLSSVEENIIFTHILAKHENCQPFRRNSVEVSPIPLLLSTLKHLKKIGAKDYFSYDREIRILIIWPNNDPIKLAKFIKQFRKDVPSTASNSVIESYILKHSGARKSWTAENHLNSLSDKTWRMLRITGLFTRKLGAIRLDHTQMPLIDYVIKNYLKIKHQNDDEATYFKYISSIDSKLLSFAQKTIFAGQNQLQNISNTLSWNQIKEELQQSSRRRDSKIKELETVAAPLRYEFICAVAITHKFKQTKVTANCKTDSFGWPLSYASGQSGTNTGADIECFENNMNFIVEPSLGTSKSEQTRECLAIDDHLDAFINQQNKVAKSFFIAPAITSRAENFSRFLDHERKGPVMKNLTTDEFIDKLEKENNLYNSFANRP